MNLLPPVPPTVERDDEQDVAPRGPRVEMTEGLQGVNIKKLKIPTASYEIALFSAPNNWVPLFQLVGMDKSVGFGRSHTMLDEGMETMAERHVRFKNTLGGVEIEPLDSLNGVYLLIARPITLTDGMRFRIGDYVLEYRDAGPGDAVSPNVAGDGERFVAQDVEPLAFLNFLRPDGQPGVSFPILKPTSTVLGRGGTDKSGAPRPVDIPLLNDKLVSGRHAEIRRSNDQFVLEDLKSTNGTFVQIREKTVVGDGSTICLGKVYLRVVRVKSLQAR
jgi:pSer/pThr/pTyr-binding forkhead associated (FHA) protein